MTDSTDPDPPVVCTLEPDRLADRLDDLEPLRTAYRGATARENGYTLRFDGSADTLGALARFVAAERECCTFADYAVETTPPYEEARLTITGPEGTREMFEHGLVSLLAARPR